MRSVIHVFLALVMLLPSLACAMPPHDMTPSPMADMPPCHEHHEAGDEASGQSGPMLMAECTGIEYAAQGIQSVDIPDQEIVDLAFSISEESAFPVRQSGLGTAIRGPPGWPETAFPEPDILLTTKRLRI